jgi:DNA-binding transcriptional regulator YdaS (Cro superfamily)
MSRELIVALGGAKAVADRLNTTHGAVRNWMLDGRAIPWKYRPAIARIAAERAVQLPETFWEGIAA